ncbi:MAG TPA: 4-oxalocrotonate tautomerase [Lysinibacillus sp.]|jgi:4-oxalocrotonate tautomerase|uniref:Tautomerase n=1 Tax=Lysinibacillus fusiformis TaxID=28031 RepID=A0A2I0V308_9BACI|nr:MULTISPECIES: 2-hydroxymuconate tautomerase [Lysinibacillus]HBT71865.1 4-oxalocrotonate tautomerase [Lysinibacillus sp.]KUF32507.1 4-oxalocrotonate tautomerase [Lysinibacillus sp. F5]MEE3808266.1 2-hydroxymuconate tautomerase [Lysinibacillus fusiformis]PKU52602.1 4-oxalocrotonate tautomerase [Lysinibacillus fusiformis]WCH47043.1 2-hydroxymuconate tautomerase family protein [Lysinibacillus sp. OF-1]
MPIVQIQLLEGRSVEQKKKIIQEVTTTIVQTARVPIDSVRVILIEVPPVHWGISGKTKAEP